MSKRQNRALLVGVGNYDKQVPGVLENIAGPEKDVAALKKTLEEFSDFEVDPPLKDPISTDVLARIASILTQAALNDLVLIYYSGHGLINSSNKLSLATKDTDATIKQNLVSFEALCEHINDRRCLEVIIILDCCYSGLVKNSLEKLALKNGEHIYVLTATSEIDAIRAKGDEVSLLTKYIVRGIRSGEADFDGDDTIRLSDLHRYAGEQIEEAGGRQTPKFWALGSSKEPIIAHANRLAEREKKALSIFAASLKREFALDKTSWQQIIAAIDERKSPLYRSLNNLYRDQTQKDEFIKQWFFSKPSNISTQNQFLTFSLRGRVPLEMVLIPGGDFIMGSPNGYGEETEWPSHKVSVASFYLGKYPITQKQWKVVMGDEPSAFKGDSLPVECISWNNAVEFCDKLSAMTKRKFRLPSEAEWEYACRADTTEDFYDTPNLIAWYKDCCDNQTHPVSAMQDSIDYKWPNKYGLYHMHGNVFEWCEDDWHDGYENAPPDGSPWESEGDRADYERVIRGGAWASSMDDCRSAARKKRRPNFIDPTVGFRVALSFECRS